MKAQKKNEELKNKMNKDNIKISHKDSNKVEVENEIATKQQEEEVQAASKAEQIADQISLDKIDSNLTPEQ